MSNKASLEMVARHPLNRIPLEEVGRFIDQGGNNFWGVQVWQFGNSEYVLASDRDYGVYIFEYTGP